MKYFILIIIMSLCLVTCKSNSMSNKFVTNEIVKRSSGVIYDSGRTLIASIDKKEISDAVDNNSKIISKKDIIDAVKHNVEVVEKDKIKEEAAIEKEETPKQKIGISEETFPKKEIETPKAKISQIKTQKIENKKLEKDNIVEQKENSINVKWEEEKKVSTDSLNILLNELMALEKQSNKIQTPQNKIGVSKIIAKKIGGGKSSADSLNILLKELASIENESEIDKTIDTKYSIDKKIHQTSIASKSTVNIKNESAIINKKDTTILSYHIIIASFALNDTQNANKFLNNIIKQGYDAHMITYKRNRIAIKSFATLKEANKNKILISTTTKFKDCWVLKYKISNNI